MDHKLYASPIVILQHEDTEDDNDEEQSIGLEEMPVASKDQFHISGSLTSPSSENDDVLGGAHRRYLGFEETWKKCHAKIRAIIQHIHTQLTDDLTEFLHDAYVSNEEMMLPQVEVPVAVVTGDSNLALNVFDTLQDRIRMQLRAGPRSSPFISVTLSAKDFGSVLSAMRALITGLIAQSPWDEASSSKRRQKVTVLPSHDITYLQAWYDHITESNSSNQGTRLVVFLPEVELCNAEALRDVLYICSLYAPHLPIIFIFSTATSDSVLQNMLPMTSRARIAVETFQLQRGLGTFESVMRGLFVDDEFDMGLMLTPTTYEHLKNSYTRHEQSLDSFESTLQLILYDHFSSPTSVFCGQDMLGDHTEALDTLADDASRPFLARLRFVVDEAAAKYPDAAATIDINQQRQSKVKSRTPKRVTEGNQLLSYVSLARKEFDEHHAGFKIALRLFRRVALEVRSHAAEMKASLSTLLGVAVQGTLVDNELLTLVEKIEQLPLERLKKVAKQVNDFCSAIDETFGHHVKALEEETASWIKELSALTPGTPAHQSTIKSPAKKAGVFELPDVSNPPEVVKTAAHIAQVLKAYFQEALAPPLTSVPLAPIWLLWSYDDPMELLNPAPRYSLLQALGATHTLLDVALLPPESSTRASTKTKAKPAPQETIFDPNDMSTLPDTAILFRRYLDSGRTINAYDWFESFAQAMSAERDRREENKMEVDAEEEVNGDDGEGDGDDMWRKELQARFLRALHELDWNGLLRGTGRKRDHVARALWDPPPLNAEPAIE